MTQLRITRHRSASARRRGQMEQLLPLDPRDPDITRAKQLQRRPRQPSATEKKLGNWRSCNMFPQVTELGTSRNLRSHQ